MYKDPNIHNLLPPRDRVYTCPCGWTAEAKYLSAHKRRDKKDLDPACKGKATPALEGARITYGEHEGWIVGPDGKPVQPPPPPTPPPPPEELARPFEFTGDEGFLDPEEVARRLNEARQSDTSEVFETPNDDGLPLDGVPSGDYFLEPPVSQPQVSTLPEKVTLPVIVRVMYDWAKSKGWNKGDGSMSAFVTDVLLDYWNNCMGMIVLVAKRDEIGVDGHWMEERALAGVPTANGKSVDK